MHLLHFLSEIKSFHKNTIFRKRLLSFWPCGLRLGFGLSECHTLLTGEWVQSRFGCVLKKIIRLLMRKARNYRSILHRVTFFYKKYLEQIQIRLATADRSKSRKSRRGFFLLKD